MILHIELLPCAAWDVLKHVKDVFHAGSCFVSEQCCTMVPLSCSHSSSEHTVNSLRVTTYKHACGLQVYSTECPMGVVANDHM